MRRLRGCALLVVACLSECAIRCRKGVQCSARKLEAQAATTTWHKPDPARPLGMRGDSSLLRASASILQASSLHQRQSLRHWPVKNREVEKRQMLANKSHRRQPALRSRASVMGLWDWQVVFVRWGSRGLCGFLVEQDRLVAGLAQHSRTHRRPIAELAAEPWSLVRSAQKTDRCLDNPSSPQTTSSICGAGIWSPHAWFPRRCRPLLRRLNRLAHCQLQTGDKASASPVVTGSLEATAPVNFYWPRRITETLLQVVAQGRMRQSVRLQLTRLTPGSLHQHPPETACKNDGEPRVELLLPALCRTAQAHLQAQGASQAPSRSSAHSKVGLQSWISEGASHSACSRCGLAQQPRSVQPHGRGPPGFLRSFKRFKCRRGATVVPPCLCFGRQGSVSTPASRRLQFAEQT